MLLISGLIICTGKLYNNSIMENILKEVYFMFTVIMENSDGRKTKGAEFRTQSQAEEYMNAMNEILFHYAGFKQSYYVELIRNSYDVREMFS